MSTPFDVFLRFTGICTLVPLEEGGVTKALMALLVDGRRAEMPGSQKQGLDGRDLSRHVGFLRFDPRDLVDCRGIPEETVGLWYPNGHRLRLKLSGGVAKGFDLQAANVTDIPQLEKIAPGFGKADPGALKAVAPRSDVLAQVLVDQGEVRQDATTLSKPTWGFSTALGGNVGPGSLAHEVLVDMGTATKVEVFARSLVEEDDEELLFTFIRDGGELKLMILNLCETNPLAWPLKVPPVRDDVDFRWHYELLEKPKEIRQRLMVLGYRRRLPCPDLMSRNTPAPSRLAAFATSTMAALGDNCYPAFAAASPFSSVL